MKRKIKFRVWDNLKSEYVDSVQIDIHGCLYKITDDGRYDVEANDIGFVAEQYTGLRDKNGKEIYEGDILKGYKEWDGKPVVVKWGEHHGKHSVGMVYGYYMPDTGLEPYHWEVIGNIHENPELLSLN